MYPGSRINIPELQHWLEGFIWKLVPNFCVHGWAYERCDNQDNIYFRPVAPLAGCEEHFVLLCGTRAQRGGGDGGEWWLGSDPQLRGLPGPSPLRPLPVLPHEVRRVQGYGLLSRAGSRLCPELRLFGIQWWGKIQMLLPVHICKKKLFLYFCSRFLQFLGLYFWYSTVQSPDKIRF